MKLRGKIHSLTNCSDLNGYYIITEQYDMPDVLFENKVYLNKTTDNQHKSKERTIYVGKPVLVTGGENQYYIDESFSWLQSGDIIQIFNGKFNVVYRVNASSTFVLTTENCNNFCLMCSQPPKSKEDNLIDNLMDLVPLLPKHLHEIGISGGEPTLKGEKFVRLLERIKAYLPFTSIHVLSNGRSLNHQLLNEIGRTKYNDLMFGIPLYSHDYATHDYIVQAKGAFNETLAGIVNLKQYNHLVEIRVVIQKHNAGSLHKLAQFIIRNLQFVDQVVFMGLEMTGFAKSNSDIVWVEPELYQEELAKAVHLLNRAKVKTRIYNHQLCILDKTLWKYNVASISDWKNLYIDECEKCSLKSTCGGFFSTSNKKFPRAIKAV